MYVSAALGKGSYVTIGRIGRCVDSHVSIIVVAAEAGFLWLQL
jgi:hypothetical protein